LYFAFTNNTAVAHTIVVGDFTMIGDGNGFEATMRMYPYSSRNFTRRKLDFGIVIEHKKWTHAVLAHIVTAWEKIMYSKAVTNRMRGDGRQNLLNCFYAHASRSE
jgi:hypothetical protein